MPKKEWKKIEKTQRKGQTKRTECIPTVVVTRSSLAFISSVDIGQRWIYRVLSRMSRIKFIGNPFLNCWCRCYVSSSPVLSIFQKNRWTLFVLVWFVSSYHSVFFPLSLLMQKCSLFGSVISIRSIRVQRVRDGSNDNTYSPVRHTIHIAHSLAE